MNYEEKRENLRALYEMLQKNPVTHSSINWDGFAAACAKVGLKYHHRLGLMSMDDWEAIKEFVLSDEGDEPRDGAK